MDELNELREALVSVRAEADRLAEELADRAARGEEMAAGIEALRAGLETARAEAAEARASAAEESQRLTERYRGALLQMLPEIPPDLIHGESVEELDRAADAAREMMTRAREQLRAETASRIPTGSPLRGTADLQSLSPSEKIRAGITERGSRQ